MNILKFIRFDLRNGLAGNWWKYLIVFCIAVLFSLALVNELSRMQAALALPLSSPTLGDCLINLVAGIDRYAFDGGYPFSLPVSWLLVFLLVAYITLNYPYRDLMGSGKLLLIEAGSRWTWWLSKCVWVVLSVLVFFAVCAAAVLVWVAANGGNFTLEVSAAAPRALGFAVDPLELHTWHVDGLFFVSVLLVTIAVCLVQMLLSLVVKPVFSFICTIALLFFSSYFETEFLPGSFLMAARSSCFQDGGMQAQVGVAIGLGVIVFTVIVGGLIFKNMDIVEGGHTA